MPGTAGRASRELLDTILRSASVETFVVAWSLSRVQLFWDHWTVARQVPLSTGFCRQDHQSALPFPSPGGLPVPEVEPAGSPGNPR